jgi:multidrug resistance efflux pump
MPITTQYRRYLPAIVRERPLWQLVAGLVVVLIVLGFVIKHFLPQAPAATTERSGSPYVQTATINELATQAGPLGVVGTVKSRSQATILAETSGQITSLSHTIGDRVAAGTVIGQFENASQRAAVTQAQGAYDAAAASLAKLQGSTAANTTITSNQASTAAQNAGAALTNALRSAYATLDDSIHAKADSLFVNPNSALPHLQSFTIPSSQLVSDIENGRIALNATLTDAEAASAGTDLDASATRMLADARVVQTFLDSMIAAMNQAVPNNYFTSAQISANQATLSGARSAVLAAVSGITGAKSAYDAAVSGAQTASNTATGGSASDIASAQAGLKSAQGSLDAARANLAKTIIRSPISGTIVSMPVTQGDFVSNFAQIAIVSNPGALYVESQVTQNDASTLSVGNAATIESSYPGVITFVAPALDPSTGKIQVKVGFTGSQGSFSDGEAVSVSLNRNKSAVTTTKNKTTAIPIVAVKITPAGPVVFSVSASSTLIAQKVALGSILGDKIVVSGIPNDLEIVTDARGRSAGEHVLMATSSSAY